MARLTSAAGSAQLLPRRPDHPCAAGGVPCRRASRGETFTHELYWAGEEAGQRAYSVSGRPSVPDGTNTGAVVTFAEVTALINALAAKDNFVATVPTSCARR